MRRSRQIAVAIALAFLLGIGAVSLASGFFGRNSAKTADKAVSSQTTLTSKGAHDLRGAVRLGRFTARLDVKPAAYGTNTLRVQLQPWTKGVAAPSSLLIGLRMVDMDMGRNEVRARAAGRNSYLTHVRLTMGGEWKATIKGGGTKAAAFFYASGQSPVAARSQPLGRFAAPFIPTSLPYEGFVTELNDNGVARLNGGTTYGGASPHGVDFVARQPYVYVTDMGSDEVRVIDIRTGKARALIPVGLAPAHVVFTPDAKRAFVTDFLSADVSVIDVPKSRLLTRIPVGLNPHGLDITPDGKFVYVACAHSGGVWVISAKTDQVAGTIPTGLEPYGVAMGPPGSGQAYVSDAAMNEVDLISLKNKRVVLRLHVGRAPALMAVTPSGELYVANHGSASVTVISLKLRKVTNTIRVGSGPHGVDVTPDGKYVYVANNDSNTVSIISTRNKRVVATIRVPGRPNEVALQQKDDVRP